MLNFQTPINGCCECICKTKINFINFNEKGTFLAFILSLLSHALLRANAKNLVMSSHPWEKTEKTKKYTVLSTVPFESKCFFPSFPFKIAAIFKTAHYASWSSSSK